jgi:membrane-bound metal-dependent hydrolase YbcI (DUF457 family)
MELLLHLRPWPRWSEAILDESGHAATTIIVLLAMASLLRRPVTLPIVLAALAGGILIDVDHIPYEIYGWNAFTLGTVRPYLHSLVTVAALAILAVTGTRSRMTMMLTVAFGVGTHLLRDMATNGVPLLWPLVTARVEILYPQYLMLLAAAAMVSVMWPCRPLAVGPPAASSGEEVDETASMVR